MPFVLLPTNNRVQQTLPGVRRLLVTFVGGHTTLAVPPAARETFLLAAATFHAAQSQVAGTRGLQLTH